MSTGSDRLDVDRLGALLALLGVVGDLRPLLQRAVTLTVDAGVMDEQVLLAVVRRDETEPLVVAEPLYGAGWHVVNSSTVRACCYARRNAAQSFDLRAPALLSPARYGQPDCTTVAGRHDHVLSRCFNSHAGGGGRPQRSWLGLWRERASSAGSRARPGGVHGAGPAARARRGA